MEGMTADATNNIPQLTSAGIHVKWKVKYQIPLTNSRTTVNPSNTDTVRPKTPAPAA